MTNYVIYNLAQYFSQHQFTEPLPVKVNFFLQKNITKIINAAKEIETLENEKSNSIKKEILDTINNSSKKYNKYIK